MVIKHILLVGLGGAVGSIARFLLQRYLHQNFPDPFPIGTFLVNVSGCFLIGVMYGLAANYAIFSNEFRLLLMAGFCGGFTTFSAYALESMALIEQQRYTTFFLYLLGSVVAGLAATFAGAWLTK
jgi:fluoride exporter